MSQRSILTPVITAAFFAVSTPAIGVDALLVELSSEASRPATNDLMQATVSAEASGASPGDLSAQINQSVAEALSAAKGFPDRQGQNREYDDLPRPFQARKDRILAHALGYRSGVV